MSPASHAQRGLSLPELMITMVISLILLAGLGQIFMSGKQSYSTQSGMGALQESGRFAMFFLQRDLRRAGFPRSFGPGGSQPLPPFVSANTTDGGAGGSDQIEIQSNSDPDVIAPIGAGNADPDTSSPADGIADNGTNQDCLGQDVPVAGNLSAGSGGVGDVANNTVRVRSRYYVDDADGDGVQSLYCLGGGNANPQPVVNGVESFQALYGEDTDGDTYANVYRNAGGVTNWDNVVAVRVALLINTGTAVAEDDDAQEYAVLDADPITPVNNPATPVNELRFRRRVFTTTIEIRNKSQ